MRRTDGTRLAKINKAFDEIDRIRNTSPAEAKRNATALRKKLKAEAREIHRGQPYIPARGMRLRYFWHALGNHDVDPKAPYLSYWPNDKDIALLAKLRAEHNEMKKKRPRREDGHD